MRLTFMGAARMVTGSCYLLEVSEHKLLIDCGMFQGSKAITSLNRRPFLFDPTELSAVLLTHAHIDHSGLLPKLVKSGYKGPIYATKATTELCGIMLPDSGHIQEYDAEVANRKGARAGRPAVEPLYTVEDAYTCLKHFYPVSYQEKISLFDGISVRFQDAGHILGSSMIEIWITENGKTTKLLFSGDIGQPDQPIINDPTAIKESDYIIMESTYGNRNHTGGDVDREALLEKIVNDTVQRGGNVIIPSFAVGRTQKLLYHLMRLFQAKRIPDIPVIIDSPLAIAATNIFYKNPQYFDSEAAEMFKNQDEFRMSQLQFTQTSQESKALNNLDTPAIIISASGMADAGRILHHLKHNLWRPDSSILFVGYQAQGSLGRRLVEGEKNIKIMGEHISVKAQIYTIDGFSAHADQEQMLEWLSKFQCQPANVFVVHGEYDSAKPFADILKEKFGFSSYIPSYGDTAILQGTEWSIEPSTVAESDPAIRQLQDFLADMERQYSDYKKQLHELVTQDRRKLGEVMLKLEKINKFIKKTLAG